MMNPKVGEKVRYVGGMEEFEKEDYEIISVISEWELALTGLKSGEVIRKHRSDFDRISDSPSTNTRMIALLAHNHMKTDLLKFVEKHKPFFESRALIATGDTGRMLSQNLGLKIKKAPHGPKGGDIVISSLIIQGKVEAVLFFRDNLTAQAHEPDVNALLRMCDIYKVPLATNEATAEAVVRWVGR